MTERLDSQSPADKEREAKRLADLREQADAYCRGEEFPRVMMEDLCEKFLVLADEKLTARSAGTRIAVDVPMIEAACAELYESFEIDLGGDEMRRVLEAAIAKTPQSATERIRPPKPRECEAGCPPQQVCDHCQWTPVLAEDHDVGGKP